MSYYANRPNETKKFDKSYKKDYDNILMSLLVFQIEKECFDFDFYDAARRP